jgi:phosphoribosylamine--glycine ligase
VLVVGSGAREHALCWSLAASPALSGLWCAPGNAGTAQHGANVAIEAGDVAGLARFAADQRIDLVVPGPELPLVSGLADALAPLGIACCGPAAEAARLEGSKSFAKEVCDAAGIATARWERFTDADLAREFVRRRGAPIVVKADGLAAGKGVVVAESVAEAEEAIAAMMQHRTLGAAGTAVVIEEALTGQEVSFFALCDGTRAIPLGAARDHKRVGEGETGPNTGGMGAFSPLPGWGAESDARIMEAVVHPVLAELARRGTPYRGILFVGLMLTGDGPKVIEFNARLGDPEAQCLLPRLGSDLLPALKAAAEGDISSVALHWRPVASVAVVIATRGYPGSVPLHTPVAGLTEAASVPDTYIFQGATVLREGQLVSAGGRVLTLVGVGADWQAARQAAYRAVDAVDWPEGFCRRDIAASRSLSA